RRARRNPSLRSNESRWSLTKRRKRLNVTSSEQSAQTTPHDRRTGRRHVHRHGPGTQLVQVLALVITTELKFRDPFVPNYLDRELARIEALPPPAGNTFAGDRY